VNWLRYVRTTRARQKIRAWLNKHDDDLIIDRSIVARQKQAEPPPPSSPEPVEPRAKHVDPDKIIDRKKVGVRIGNERNMMIRFANCCNPTTGDDIIGYVSRGRGIIVHRRDCPNLRYINDFEERTMDVEWETVSPHETRTFKVSAHKIPDLFSEIEGAVRKYKGHLIEGKIEDIDNGRVEAIFTMEIERREDFKKVMKSIRTVPAVLNIVEHHRHSTGMHA
jgi:GTP pyrophosphokinase